jgi:enterochelin esterase family protein
MLFYTSSYAAEQRRMSGPPPFARVKSPEFNSNGTITFRIWAPKADEVKLECAALLDGQPNLLERFDQDYWRITIAPAKSGEFRYKFLIDGVQTVDPVNPLTIEKSSLLFVPGEDTEFFTASNVPHGTVHRHFYHNPKIEAIRSVSVYTPPDYKENGEKIYPVLFLFHGSGGTDESWFKAGHANIILDNLISNGAATSMIVVAPFGHTVEPGTHGWPFVQEKGDFIDDFFETLLPILENQYRISVNPSERALAGFSMGGFHTLKIGLNNLDQFANLGVFSWGNEDFFEDHAPHVLVDPQKLNDQLGAFFIACGEDDFLLKGTKEMHTLLSSLNVDHSFHTTDGGHDMSNWRKYLYKFAQIIF